MTSMLRFLRKVRLLFGREKFRDELNEEMAFHRAEAEKEFIDERNDSRGGEVCGAAAVWQCDAAERAE